jgi:hypothetical protein
MVVLEVLLVVMPSKNELWPDLAFSGCGWKIYGELWKADEAGLGRMSPTHASFFVPFWNLIWTLVRTLLVTDLEISGLICNLQGCSGCFGTHCICKSSIDCTEKYSFFGVLLGSSEVLVPSHHPTPLVQSPQVKSIISKRIYRVCAFVNSWYNARRSKYAPKTWFELRSLRCILSIIVMC